MFDVLLLLSSEYFDVTVHFVYGTLSQ